MKNERERERELEWDGRISFNLWRFVNFCHFLINSKNLFKLISITRCCSPSSAGRKTQDIVRWFLRAETCCVREPNRKNIERGNKKWDYGNKIIGTHRSVEKYFIFFLHIHNRFFPSPSGSSILCCRPRICTHFPVAYLFFFPSRSRKYTYDYIVRSKLWWNHCRSHASKSIHRWKIFSRVVNFFLTSPWLLLVWLN